LKPRFLNGLMWHDRDQFYKLIVKIDEEVFHSLHLIYLHKCSVTFCLVGETSTNVALMNNYLFLCCLIRYLPN
jgi:hypothetical protein